MMYLAAIEFGTVSADSLVQNLTSTVLYFVVGILLLVAGFVMVDALTPGNLRTQVFVERRPNAVVVTSASYLSLMVVIIAAITASSDQLGQGIVETLVFGLVGVALQGVALAILEAAVPGRYRDLVDAEQFHPASIATGVVLLAVGGINAAALS